MNAHHWLLTLDCVDRPGIVAKVSNFLALIGGFILDSQQYADLETGRFFMRVEFTHVENPFALEDLRRRFEPVAGELDLTWSLMDSKERPRILIAVSKASHCLNDLLYRWKNGGLNVDIVGVVSNHTTLSGLTEWYGVPFTHLSPDRSRQETEIVSRFVTGRADFLVLARYMQILSPELADRLEGRCINIHHSFLPGFKGAHPYRRAHERGVKLIGATAHFVTRELDEGPIIEQEVTRVDHRATVDDMIRIGRDIEAQVLARAVESVGARRVFLNGARTIVFR